jgi:hypothetical protein
VKNKVVQRKKTRGNKNKREENKSLHGGKKVKDQSILIFSA